MLKPWVSWIFRAALMVVLEAAAAYGQTPDIRPANLAGEVVGLKAENAALREQQRKVEDQQKTLLASANFATPMNTAPASDFIPCCHTEFGLPVKDFESTDLPSLPQFRHTLPGSAVGSRWFK